MQPDERCEIARLIVRWFARQARPLPWRAERTPYRTWISEIMAQQTRLATVVPYFERFVARFPDVSTLAAASVDDVLALWSGLGYYRRARQLHDAARALVERYGGELPADAAKLRELPGVGPYVAGAVASLAFDLPEPILDGNVVRVLSRLFAIEGDPNRAATRRRLWSIAEGLLPARRPGAFNEGLMELGALVCLPRNPLCRQCPLRRRCRAGLAGRAAEFPPRKRRAPAKTITVLAAVVRDGRGRVLLVRGSLAGLYDGVWMPPHFASPAGLASEAKRIWLTQSLGRLVGAEIAVGRRIRTVRHVLSHRILCAHVYECRWTDGKTLKSGRNRQWRNLPGVSPSLALPTFAKKIFAADDESGGPRFSAQ